MLVHIDRDGQRFGPYDLETLRQYVATGHVLPSDMAWTDGLTEWEPVSVLLGGSAPPPPPPPRPRPGATSLGQPKAHAAFPKAGFGDRFLAALIDTGWCLLFMIPGTLVVLAGINGAASRGADFNGTTAFGVFLIIAALCYIVWYSFVKDGTPIGAGKGKKMMGLMVVHLPTGAPCTRGQSALRQLVMALLGLIPYVGWLIEPLVALTAEDGRRLGDRAADTQVIRAEDYVQAQTTAELAELATEWS
ncbi:MAG TPA: RDD family protein [Gemmatimonadales bacterium]|nr:RDD family protein [Gemmatimonadales bacterium]